MDLLALLLRCCSPDDQDKGFQASEDLFQQQRLLVWEELEVLSMQAPLGMMPVEELPEMLPVEGVLEALPVKGELGSLLLELEEALQQVQRMRLEG